MIFPSSLFGRREASSSTVMPSTMSAWLTSLSSSARASMNAMWLLAAAYSFWRLGEIFQNSPSVTYDQSSLWSR
jgi:hypothetical protein